MDPVRWTRLKQIVGEAIELPSEDRDAFLAAACGDDAALAAEARSLLAYDDESGQLLDDGAAALIAENEPLAGLTLGPWRLEEEIGHGGMGTVHRAERIDGAYRQEVAVKVIRRGMDTEQVLRRFRVERQILASLGHPNIARLLDGGALPDGRPYLVMEHVDGRRIDRYCADEHLDPAARLRLFLQVCAAVSFAHQRLVVHRDLKPGNVLVDRDGNPKLLDFGIAKLLGAEGDGAEGPATETIARPMTPEYASPEQISGDPVTTATDVYALGVLLYELLTGQRPHSATGSRPQALLDAIRQTDPVRPSHAAPADVRRRLQGDLDVILLTALRKEPERRYPSVEAFAADIRRHLEGLPVLARRDSWSYRASRFLSRNVVPVTAAALVAAALVTGTLVAWHQARVARAERALAQKRQNDTLVLTNAMLFELFEGVDQGPARARQMIVTRAFGYLDRLSREAPDDPAMIHELASAWSRVGALQGGTWNAAGAGGDSKKARASYLRALELRNRLSRLAPDHFENRRDLGVLQIALGALSSIEGETSAALESHRRGLALLERCNAERPNEPETQTELARAHVRIAQALGSSDAIANVGKPAQAEPHVVAAIRLNEGLVARRPGDLNLRQFLVALYNEQATCLTKLGRRGEALEAQKKAIAAAEALVERSPDSLLYRRELAVGYGNLAASILATNKAGALEYTRKALPLYEFVARAVPGDPDALRDLAIGYRNLGKALTSGGDPDAALPHLRRAVALLADLTKASPGSAFLERQLAFTHLVMADTLLTGGDARLSLAEVGKGIRIGEGLVAKDGTNMVAWRTLAMSYAQAGEAAEALATKGGAASWREARTWYLRSREAWAELQKAGEIPPTNAAQVEQVREAIARCDDALRGS